MDRKDFDALARKHGVERASKGFGSWDQFVAMAFAQLSDAGSLRETILGLASASGKLRHLGIDSAPWRSTLSDLAASTVGRIYRERWKIEMFFKALKQNLRVKTFLGTKKTAVLTQIWTALIAILLMKYLQMRSQWSWSMSNLIAALRVCMFAHKDLWDWLDDPTA